MNGSGVITAYKLAVLEILRNCFVLAYIACPRYPYIIESTDSMIMLRFCVKTIMKASCNFELAHLKKKKRKKTILAIWRLSGLVLLQCFFAPMGVLFVIKTLEDEQYVVIKAYKFIVLS